MTILSCFFAQDIFHPYQSVEYRKENDPSVSLKVEFQGARTIEEAQQSFDDGGSTLVVYGTLKLKSIPGEALGSWDIGNHDSHGK